MFKKKNQGGSALTDRIKAVSGHDTSEERSYVDTHIRKGDRAKRDPTYKQATIQLRGGERLPVVVKNVSDTGARIEFFKDIPLSDVVYLIEPTLNIQTWCDVVWEEDNSAGLHFIES